MTASHTVLKFSRLLVLEREVGYGLDELAQYELLPSMIYLNTMGIRVERKGLFDKELV